MYWQTRKDRVSEYICVRASGASERFLEFLIVLQFKRSISLQYMSNLRLSYLQKVGGGGGYLYRPSPPPKKVGGCIPHPPLDLRQCIESSF